jgi:hypothetical protein
VSFPNLARRPDPESPDGLSVLYAEAIGVPDDGNNTFELPFVSAGVDPALVDADWLEFDVFLNGDDGTIPGVDGAVFIGLAANKVDCTVNFNQTAPGVGTARMVCRLIHSVER